jgi:hypothetical protein
MMSFRSFICCRSLNVPGSVSYYHADITQWYNLENVKGPCVHLLCLEVFRTLFPAVLPPKHNSDVAEGRFYLTVMSFVPCKLLF